MRFRQFAIEEKGNVGVKFLLKLEELQVGIIPRPRLPHREEDLVGLRLVRKKIDHTGMFETARLLCLVRHRRKSLSLAIARASEMLARMKMTALRALGILAFCLTNAHAQFNPAFVQNSSYWNDGKAEFDLYDAQLVREGQPRQTEVLHILVREPFDLKQLVKADDAQRPGVIPVLKMNQILHAPTGLYVVQQMHSNFWRADNARLAKFSLTSSDSCGNTCKEGRRSGEIFTCEWHTYWDGMADGREQVSLPPNGFFYDELPLRVRTIDFTKPSGQFEIQLAPTIISAKKTELIWKPAQVSYKTGEKFINVTVEHIGGRDEFVLDRDFPHLLREWIAADGSHLKLKRTLKVAYWKYGKNGDRERALADPMLRPPD